MKRIYILFALLFVTFSVCSAKSNMAKFAYIFFDSENKWTFSNDTIGISVSIVPSCTHVREMGHCLYNEPYYKVKLENLTEDMIYIDLGASFLLRGKKAQMLWDNRQTFNTNSSSYGGATSIGNLAFGLTLGGSRTSSTTTVQQAERILRMPPFSEEVFTIPVYSADMEWIFEKKANSSWYGNTLAIYTQLEIGQEIKYDISSSRLTGKFFFKYGLEENSANSHKTNVSFFANKIVGTKEWIGTEKSEKKINNMGYNLNSLTPYIMVKIEK